MHALLERAATSPRPDSATFFAAAAVFSQGIILTPLSVARNSLHWLMACSCEYISFMSSSFVPWLTSRLWSTFRRTLRTILKSCFIIRSYTAFTLPAVLFSTGITPYWHRPFSIAENTASNVEK